MVFREGYDDTPTLAVMDNLLNLVSLIGSGRSYSITFEESDLAHTPLTIAM